MPAASAAPRHAASIPAKNRFHHLLPHFSFQRSDAILIAAISARSGKRLGAKLAQLAPPAVQNVRVYLADTGHFGHRCPPLQPPNCGFLKLPRELPSIQTHDTILHSLRDVSYSPVSISGSTPSKASSTQEEYTSTLCICRERQVSLCAVVVLIGDGLEPNGLA